MATPQEDLKRFVDANIITFSTDHHDDPMISKIIAAPAIPNADVAVELQTHLKAAGITPDGATNSKVQIEDSADTQALLATANIQILTPSQVAAREPVREFVEENKVRFQSGKVDGAVLARFDDKADADKLAGLLQAAGVAAQTTVYSRGGESVASPSVVIPDSERPALAKVFGRDRVEESVQQTSLSSRATEGAINPQALEEAKLRQDQRGLPV